MTGASTPIEVLCCYSHADERWLPKLETHLSLLKQQGLVRDSQYFGLLLRGKNATR